MKKTYGYRLYPTRKQQRVLNQQLDTCRCLYNQLLNERKTSYETTKTSPSCYDQQLELTNQRNSCPESGLSSVHSQVLQNVAVRVNLAYQAFYRRVKAGEQNVGYPRFKGQNRYDSLTFPQAGVTGCGLDEQGRTVVSGVGHIKTRLHRPIKGRMKTAVLKRTPTNKWFVTFSCENVPTVRLPKSRKVVGCDLGVSTFAIFSDGFTVENPRHLNEDIKELKRVNRKLWDTPMDSSERRKRQLAHARVEERIANRRDDFTHKLARTVSGKYGTVIVEDLTIDGMGRCRRERRDIRDAAWGMFVSRLEVKAEEAGRRVIRVNPAFTSQTCSKCGHVDSASRKGIKFKCTSCGFELNADLNASRVIKDRGVTRSGGLESSGSPRL
jgi:putative transposase